MDEMIFVKLFKTLVFNILIRKLLNMSSKECEYNFVAITAARLKSDNVVKACNFIGQKNIN